MSESQTAKLAMYLMSSPPGKHFFKKIRKNDEKNAKRRAKTGFNKACRNINAAKCVDGVFRDLVRTQDL